MLSPNKSGGFMNLESFSALDEEITKEDWRQTPTNVRRLLRWLVEDFERRLVALEEDKILSRVESAPTHAQEMRNQSKESEEQSEELEDRDIVRCSFCGQSSTDVAKIITGPNVNICNECIDICNEILADNLASK